MKETFLPTGENIEATRLRRDFHVVENPCPDHPGMAFRCVMPKRFVEVESPPPADPPEPLALVTVATYQDEATRSSIIFQRQPLPRGIGAAHWLRLIAMQTDKDIEVLHTVSDAFAEAKIRFTEGDDLFAARFAVQIAGGDAILQIGTCRYNDYTDMAEEFGMMLATWQLLAPPEEPTVEPMRDVPLGPLTIPVPASWKPAPPDENSPAIRLFANLDDDGELNGLLWLHLDATGANLPDDAADAFLKGLDLHSFKTVAEETVAIGLEEGGTAKHRHLLASAPNVQSMEIRRLDASLQKSGLLQIILVTPPEDRDETFHVWGFNIHVFHHAIMNIAAK
jgi:hypothetical protein